MIRLRLLLLLFTMTCTQVVFGQKQLDVMRYEYDVTFKPNKDNLDLVFTEKAYLDVYGTSSRFYSKAEAFKVELLAQPANNVFIGKSVNPPGALPSNFTDVIVKERGENYYYEKIGGEMMKLASPITEIKWDIQQEVMDYNGLSAQKAVGTLNGRVWTVWFTTAIAITEGPYKFKNLPGFVVKAEDEHGAYQFEFVKSEKASIARDYNEYDLASVVSVKELVRIRDIHYAKTLGQVLREQGVTLNTEDNPDLKEQLNEKMSDSNNYIEWLVQ